MMHTNSTRKPRSDWPTTSARISRQVGVHGPDGHRIMQFAGGHWFAVPCHDMIVMAALRHAIRIDAHRCKIIERPALDHINNRPC